MTRRDGMRLVYGALAVLSMMLTALQGELVQGRVPIPAGMSWLIPVIVAGIIGATALLPRVGDVRNTGEQ